MIYGLRKAHKKLRKEHLKVNDERIIEYDWQSRTAIRGVCVEVIDCLMYKLSTFSIGKILSSGTS